MKRILMASLVTGLIASTSALQAGPIKKGWIGGDAQWAAHVDFDSARESQLGRFIIEHQDDLDIEWGELEEMGIDPLEDFYAITLYGVGDPEEEGIVILQMNDKIDHLIKWAKEEAGEDDFSEQRVDGRTIYNFDGGEMHGYIHKHSSGRRTVVLASAVDRVMNAIRVIEGDKSDLTDNDDPAIRPNPRDGAIVYACAAGAPWLPHGDDPASQVMRLADGIACQLGEAEGNTFVDLALHTEDSESAASIAQIVQGALALGQLMTAQGNGEMEPFKDLLNGIKVKANDKGIKIGLAMDTDDLLKIAAQAMEQHESDDDDDHDDDDDDDDDDWDNM